MRSIHLAGEIGMGHHTLRIDPGISAPGTYKRHRSTHKCSQGLLKNLLHSYSIRLHLPTVICGTIVREVYEIALHQISFLSMNV
jgi:hypothetical protein